MERHRGYKRCRQLLLRESRLVGRLIFGEGTLDMITDGDKSGDEGSWIELGPGKQWVRDLSLQVVCDGASPDNSCNPANG